jgi:hypothetical protein
MGCVLAGDALLETLPLAVRLSAPTVVVEVVPLVLERGAIQVLRPRDAGAWLVPCVGDQHPEEQARAAIHGQGWRLNVLHSTSWRWESGYLLLTYLAVVDVEGPLTNWHVQPLAAASLARGAATSAPPVIAHDQVVAHGLRHLAWLARDDSAVQATLTPAWLLALDVVDATPLLGPARAA